MSNQVKKIIINSIFYVQNVILFLILINIVCQNPVMLLKPFETSTVVCSVALHTVLIKSIHPLGCFPC